MKQSAGIITALAAVLALFGLSNLPKSSTGSGSATTAQSDQGVKPPVKAKHDYTISYACGKIQESIQPLVAVNPDQPWRVPSFCYANPEATKDPILIAPENLVFAIAMAPNPIATHLPLLFDRNIEIIEQAAQDNNYSYDSSWLPWGERSRYVRYPDQLAAEESQSDNEKQPGVLVFRNSPKLSDPSPYKSGLVVFVVSELPTGGINREEFESALGWIEQLKGAEPKGALRILGPSFSGSLPSLYDLLQECHTKSSVCRNTIRVSSGSVSSDSSYHWFRSRLEGEHLGTFDTALEGDCRMLNRFLAYVNNQHYSIKHVAVLSEDETAFGGSPESAAQKLNESICQYPPNLAYLYYPRDIATLRSAYEQQSIFKSSKQTSDSTSSSATTTLRGDLSEPANGHHDTVRTYAGQLTPLAQESVLLSIVDVLKAKDVQFVVVRSTNSLDQIFLGQFLRRSFPDVRIVMDGADLLFRRGAEGSSLRGVMVLSTYPLLAWQQDWTSNDPGESAGSYRIFGQDTSEGLYIAARELLLPDGNTTKDVSDLKISNYAPPAWARSQDDPDVDDDGRPATWLTVIGHRQFWPVAVLNSNTLSAKDPQSKKPQEFKPGSLLAARSNRNDALIAVSGNEHPLRRVPNEFWILVIFCVGWSAAHRLWCARGSISPLPAPFRLAYFAAIPLWQQPALVGFGSALIAGVGVVLGVAAGFLRWEPASWNFFIGGLVLAIFVLACVGCAENFKLPTVTEKGFSETATARWRFRAGVCAAVIVVVFFAIEWIFVHLLTKANLVPVFWRSIHIISGVSALLPQLFLLTGMYCWFWFSLRGLALFGDDRPRLPKLEDMNIPNGPRALRMFSREDAGKSVECCALPISRRYLGLLILIVPAVGVISAVVLSGPWLRTLGELTFGIFIFLWLTLCISLVLADAAQCWCTWRQLRELLIDLDRLPLRRTLYALHGLSWRSVWAMSGNVLTERYSLISRQIEALRHLGNRLAEYVPATPDRAQSQTALLLKIRQCQTRTIPNLAQWYTELNDKPVDTVQPLAEVQEEFASIAGETLTGVLIPSWQTEMDSLILGRPDVKNAADADRSGPVISRNIPVYVLAAEEFFVLPYVGFIQNILGRIRTIVLGSLWLFVATTLAVSSYPFDPMPILGGIFLAVFVIIGTTMILIYAGMHRDATLSYITGSEPGELGGEFWRQLFTFGIGPLLGLLTTLFPSITDFVMSWLQPSSQAIK